MDGEEHGPSWGDIMSILTGKSIRERLDSGTDLDLRLVISPLLNPEEQARKDQASVDVRLGFQFALNTPSVVGAIDEFVDASKREVSSLWPELFKFEHVPFGRSIVLHPQKFILASTLEYIRIPRDLSAQVVGRSSWGRLGLVVATAVGIQPLFAGTLALELRNLGETPIVLYPGQNIAQLFLFTLDNHVDGDALGQYSGSVDLCPGSLSSLVQSQSPCSWAPCHPLRSC